MKWSWWVLAMNVGRFLSKQPDGLFSRKVDEGRG